MPEDMNLDRIPDQPDSSGAPFFSICIPAFNIGYSINSCLKSIAEQSFSSYEVILVDDGSSQPLSDCIDFAAIRGMQLSLIENENKGPYEARKIAIANSKGAYILFVDADDCLSNDRVLAEIYQQLANDDVDILLFNATSDALGGKRLISYEPNFQNGYIDINSFVRCFVGAHLYNSLWTKAFKRSVIARPYVDAPRLTMAEDRLQVHEALLNAYNIKLFDEPLYKYRQFEGSTIQSSYLPSYFRQSCYVEGRIVSERCLQGEELALWADGFSFVIVNALVSISRNSDMSRQSRLDAMKSMRREDACVSALAVMRYSNMSLGRALMMGLFTAKRFGLIDYLCRLMNICRQ